MRAEPWFPLRTAIGILEQVESRSVRPAEVRRLADGNTTLVTDGLFVVRVGHAWPLDPALEARCCACARDGGVPAPEIAHIGTARGRPYLVYRRIEGYHPRPGVLTGLIAEALARLHACDPAPFPLIQTARPRRRDRFILADKALTSLLDRGLGRTVARLISAAAADWASRADVPVHGDYRAPNLLVQHDALTGVLDWTDVRRASRESDLGNVEISDLEPLVATYERVTGLRLDRAVIAGHALARHFALAAAGIIPIAGARRAAKYLVRWPACG
ncbi:MAG: phosphotransferase family protein [Pseudonocardiaceae bacterium]